ALARDRADLGLAELVGRVVRVAARLVPEEHERTVLAGARRAGPDLDGLTGERLRPRRDRRARARHLRQKLRGWTLAAVVGRRGGRVRRPRRRVHVLFAAAGA